MKAEVIHWWTSGGESAAVKVFADQFKKAGGVWIDSAVAGGVNARTAAINRTIGGNPPTAMQFNTGKQFDELVEGNLLSDVEAVASENKWRSFMPEAIVRATVRNGKMFAVPVNIHGQNWLFFNKAVLEKVGAAEPTNWTDVFAALDKVKAAGLIPLAFSGVKNWERNLFNAVLVGQGGAAMFEGLYGKRDAALAASAEFKAVAETYAKLRGYVDRGRARPQLERRDHAGDPGQGRHADHGRLGQGRVRRRGPDRRQGIRLHRAVEQGHRLRDGRRRLRVSRS